MLTFRQKIFLSYLVIFLFFLILLFPYSSRSVRNAVKKVLEDRTSHVIENIQKAHSVQGMIEILNAHQSLVFFRVTLLSEDGRILYESHADRSALPLYKRHPEIEKALINQIGYHEDYSYHFGEHFAYIAQTFQFENQTFIIRTAFPMNQIKDMTRDFKGVLIKFGIGILVLFSLLTWAMISLLTRPIQTIIDKIKPYQEKKTEHLPEIILEEKNVSKDFHQLANTLNSLSTRIHQQIDTLKEERNQTESVLNSLAEGVIAVNSNQNVIYVNDVALKMFHFEREMLMHQHISLLKSAKCQNLLQTCQDKEKIIYDTLELKDGEKKIPLGIVVTPSRDQGAILVLQDKSHVFQILDMGKTFIANASHELKTPLTVVRGFAETLHDYPEIETQIQKELTEKIVANCVRMEALVKNLLTLTDIESLPRSQLQECNVMATLDDCVSTLKSIHPKLEIELKDETHNLATVQADPDLLNRAIMNLMENAVKYNQNPPVIKLQLTQEDQKFKLTIQDNGIGIPAKDLPHIFERFYRVDKARSRKLGGSGLGLSIVKIIIEKLHGTISAESEPGLGSTFTLIFPDSSAQDFL